MNYHIKIGGKNMDIITKTEEIIKNILEKNNFNEENVVADKLIIFASVIFVGVTIILFVTYFIHLFWMIQEKRKPQNLKSDIIFLIVLVLTLSAYDIYAGRFVWEDIWKKFILVILIILSSEIGQYIFSWKE